MGYAKDRKIQEDEQGWRFSGGTEICWRCLSNPYLRSYARSNATGWKCDFCHRSSRKHPSAVPFDKVMQIIASAIHARYNDANNETIPWDGEEGGYDGTTYSSYEIVHYKIPIPSDNEHVLERITACLPDYVWCQRHFASLTHEETFAAGWEDFCRTVKHHARYLFAQQPPDPNSDSFERNIPVANMLEELGKLVASHGLTHTLPIGTRVVRLRLHQKGECPVTPADLGSPPPERATTSRMSPAGISLFYAATDERTARAETFNLTPKSTPEYGTVAAWTSTRELLILDLTQPVDSPSFYDAEEIFSYEEVRFLGSFIADIAQPISRDGREHIDYVPTQIVTEYFRTIFRDSGDRRLDGIMYPSAQREGGKCIALFVSHDQLSSEHRWRARPAPIMLDADSIRRTRSRHPKHK
jgi:hypothetical protein